MDKGRIAVAFVVLLAAAVAAAAQPPGSRLPRGSRDTAPRRPVGTASIAGHVVAADTGRPLGRVRVTVTASDTSDLSIATLTDASGAYLVADLPAGTYTVVATKTSFVTLAYGARRPQRPGTRLQLRDAQLLRDVDIRLPRGSVVTGRVYDDGGEPIVRATVQALRYQYLQGEPRLVGSATAQTDDRGQFRIYGLAPGNYVVSAAARLEVPDAEARRADPSLAQSYAPTYYPGVTNPADAGTIALGVQQEFANVDFMLQVVPTARVSGTVVSEVPGASASMVVLATDDPRGVTAGSTHAARVQDDGTFVVDGVPPGRYIVIARGGGGRGRPAAEGRAFAATLLGTAPVTVGGQDVTGISVVLSAGGSVAGWISTESATGVRLDPSQVRLGTVPRTVLPFIGSETARVQADGSFLIPNVVAGPHLLRLQAAPKGWALKGIFVNGRDVSDQAIDVRAGQTVGGVQVVFTDRLTTIGGRVTDASGQAVGDCSVVLFPVDQAAWRPRSRGIQGVRSAPDGTFTFANVPPGDYQVAPADEIEAGSWFDPAVLEGLRPSATPISVEEGDSKSVTLKIGTEGDR